VPEVLKPEKTSRENIQLFLESIEDDGLHQLLQGNLDQILSIGAGRGDRETFFVAVRNLIEERIRGKDENQGN
jgi:hypothetical protein